jgi:hypothetical protein
MGESVFFTPMTLNLDPWKFSVCLSLLAHGSLGLAFLPDSNASKPPEPQSTRSTQSTPQANQSISTGFQVLVSRPGVQVYKHRNRQDYVTVANLQTASLVNLTGPATEAPMAKIRHRSLKEFWQTATDNASRQQEPVVLINGTFFQVYKPPTEIAFGLKSGGQVMSYGYGLDEFPGLTRTISWGAGKATLQIQPYRRETFDSQTANVVGGLDPVAGMHVNRALARTFMGIADTDKDGKNETVLVFSSPAARQGEAAETLRQFGANSVIMLDGGGSTGLVLGGKTYLKPNTPVPHALAIYASR